MAPVLSPSDFGIVVSDADGSGVGVTEDANNVVVDVNEIEEVGEDKGGKEAE